MTCAHRLEVPASKPSPLSQEALSFPEKHGYWILEVTRSFQNELAQLGQRKAIFHKI